MIEIHQRLKSDKIRFSRIASRDKFAIDKGWNKLNLQWNDSSLQEHLKRNGNYGVLTGINGLIVVDIDSQEHLKWTWENLPPTFTVKTGKGLHFYYFCSEIDKKIILNEVVEE